MKTVTINPPSTTFTTKITVPDLPTGTYYIDVGSRLDVGIQSFPSFTIVPGPSPTATLHYPTATITPSHIVRGKIQGLSTAEVTGWLDDTQIGVANCK